MAKYAKYDWILIKSEFVEGIQGEDGEPYYPTLDELCQRHDASISTMKKKSADDNWVRERNLYRTKLEQKVQEKKILHTASEVASLSSNALSTAEKAIKKINEKLDDEDGDQYS